jgi:hypothetical protein
MVLLTQRQVRRLHHRSLVVGMWQGMSEEWQFQRQSLVMVMQVMQQ